MSLPATSLRNTPTCMTHPTKGAGRSLRARHVQQRSTNLRVEMASRYAFLTLLACRTHVEYHGTNSTRPVLRRPYRIISSLSTTPSSSPMAQSRDSASQQTMRFPSCRPSILAHSLKTLVSCSQTSLAYPRI